MAAASASHSIRKQRNLNSKFNFQLSAMLLRAHNAIHKFGKKNP